VASIGSDGVAVRSTFFTAPRGPEREAVQRDARHLASIRYALIDDRFVCNYNCTTIIGGLAILLVAIWMGGYEDGFSWSEDPEREFHYHPTFMVMGMKRRLSFNSQDHFSMEIAHHAVGRGAGTITFHDHTAEMLGEHARYEIAQ
ncbi:hypothetical protein TELCIR_13055, partial [Teladorsagia circumcincta]